VPSKSSDSDPQFPGGGPAERLREFIEQRYPEGVTPPADEPEPDPDVVGSDEQPDDHDDDGSGRADPEGHEAEDLGGPA
jgi:hypothetical protein